MELEEISAEAAQETTEVTETAEQEPVKQETAPIESEEEVAPDPIDIIKDLPPRKKTAAERIAELTWKAKEKEREAEYWREQANKKPQAEKPVQSDRPRLEQFDTQEEYEDALLGWHERKSSERIQTEKQNEREAEAIRKFNANATKLRELHDDFDEVVQAPVFTKTMRSVLLESEQGPIMAYYLGRPENIQVAERIASLPPDIQSYEIGKLETQLILAQKTKKVTSAPPPINPVGGAATSVVDEDNLGDDEWYKLHQKKRLQRLKDKYGG